ncbi:hypothetical protein PG994_004173 [Apiospora phragmitis]|uniref:Uncharacterized protein n=1 Tax=Apiospora phragmitis TaxID=2905665 RepID=A0ABR1VPU2_9PEZI
MDEINIAVIGTGPAGLTALKTLREEGFNAIAFERRDRIGGLWSYSDNPAFTSVVDGSVCNISKFVSGTVQGKRVLVVGMGNTGSDIATALCSRSHSSYASTTTSTTITTAPSKIYHSYRRGRLMISRYEADGTPLDIKLSWPVTCLKYLLDAWAPWLMVPLIDRFMLRKMIGDAARSEPELQPGEALAQRRKRAERKVRLDWRLADFPSMSRRHPAVNEHWFPAVQAGAITPVHGLKGFMGEREVLLDDGTLLEVDAVIVCTGYQYFDFNLMPELDMDGADGPPLEAVWNTCELASMAVAQIWAAETAKKSLINNLKGTAPLSPPEGYRQPARLPPADEMNAQVDAYHRWWRAQWAQDRSTLPGFVQGDPFNRFLHGAAGTGLYERLDHVFAYEDVENLRRDAAKKSATKTK